ncbi:MAG: glycosyltransferase [Phycisphaerae bacterium]|nr:glycosyltransferase [Phycisphaerae bacterium]
MKIAMLSDALTTGGAERQLLLSAAELQKMGHNVKVIIYYPNIEFQHFIEQNNIDLVQIKSKGFLRIGRICALARYLRQENFDVVHAFKGTVSIFGALAARLAGIKWVFGGFRSIYNESIIFRISHGFVNKLLTGWIVNSKAIADAMAAAVKINPKKFSVVYNGICPDTFKSNLSKDAAKHKLGMTKEQLAVAMVARLERAKNHQMFLKMASVILKRRQHVKFLIIGDGSLRKTIEDKCESLGISDNVIFLGNRKDIPDILAATDVAVLTSDSEGFPNALIEPMCVGIAVVSTDYPSIYELIVDGKSGFIVPRNNAEAMAVRVAELLDDIDLRKRLGREGAKTVHERLTPYVMAKNLISIYKQDFNNRQHFNDVS